MNSQPVGHEDAAIEWWRNAVVYQIYVRSFADGNSDGTGDIAGIRHRLPYLSELGVDAIWVNPWYSSPLNDGGYDVADYRVVDPRYGTTDEAKLLFDEARALGIRVLVDLVPNHTSSEHRWFREALASAPGSEARARYHFVAGRGDHGELPPSDWPSVFGGDAWTRLDDGDWYLHIFDATQPDLNWRHPEVISEFEDILRFWLDLGAAGFRVDVAHALTKDTDYPDLVDITRRDGPTWTEGHPFWDRDDLHEIVRGWRSVLDGYDNVMMVAEAWIRADRRPLYLRPDEYHQAFDFDLLAARWNADVFESTIDRGIQAAVSVGSSPTWVLSNHDVIRHRTRYALEEGVDHEAWLMAPDPAVCDLELGEARARAAALLVLALPGSTYVYQGDELGLPEVTGLPDSVIDDPMWLNSGKTRRGRDGCRVPMPWDSDGPSQGFSSAPPWLPQPEDFGRYAAKQQASEVESMLTLYRQAIALRKETIEPSDGLAFSDLGADVLAFRRGASFTCIVNMGTAPVPLPDGSVVLASAPIAGNVLPGNAAVWLQ